MFRKVFLFLLISFNLYAQDSCSNLFQALPNIESAQVIEKTLNGKSYRIYENVSAQALKNSNEYNQFVDNTIEVMFEPAEPFGHIRLRAGKKVYSFNFIQSTSIGDYVPRAREGHFGFAYYVDKSKLKDFEQEMIKFYESSRSYNFPPFDAYSPKLKIVREGSGLKYISPSPDYANNSYVQGEIFEEAGSYFIKNGDYKFPISKLDDETFEIQSYSCISSADFWTRKLGIQLNPNYAAKGLKDALLSEHHGLSQPDIILKYAD